MDTYASLNLTYEGVNDIDNDTITLEHSVLSLLQRQHISGQTSKIYSLQVLLERHLGNNLCYLMLLCNPRKHAFH